MKKVREIDLINLITDFYCKFIAHISQEEHYNLSYDEKVRIIVNSTHIKVWWNYDKDLEIEADTKNFVENFAKEIEKVTFGNLQVTYYSTGTVSNNTTIFEIYIANAYEVIE